MLLLNLTYALLSLPQAAENQAMDRVHRIGQVRDVRVIRFLMKDSIEERMVRLQESKAMLGKGTQERLDPVEKRKARLTFLKDLFRIEDEDTIWAAK
jgi:DNA repair protein RAD5